MKPIVYRVVKMKTELPIWNMNAVLSWNMTTAGITGPCFAEWEIISAVILITACATKIAEDRYSVARYACPAVIDKVSPMFGSTGGTGT